MLFKLIAPDFVNGQDHTFTQDEARQNARQAHLCEEIVLSDASVYVHTAHDDTLTQYTAYFPPNKKDKNKRGNRWRLAVLGRTLAKTKLYCVDRRDPPAKRHSVVEAAAFLELDKMKCASNCWSKLEYSCDKLPWLDLKSE